MDTALSRVMVITLGTIKMGCLITSYLGFRVVSVFLHCGINTCLLCVTDKFGFKQEERFDCGAKSGDVFASQRRFPQPLFWDYKVHICGE